ncbi:MAG: DUF692 domain-containing protein [Myxococcota bacterium]
MAEVEGIGLGLRMELSKELLERNPPEVRWVELHPENYMRRGGRYETLLKTARDRWPIVTHGLTMGYGAVAPFEREYLDPLADFLKAAGTPWHSDHLCFAGSEGAFVHDLLPIPFNEEAAKTVAQRIAEARDVTQTEIAFENVSFYAPSEASESDEPTFIREVLERADAKMLLDINNVFVNSQNFGFDPKAWIDQIPPERVVQYHVAGHLVRDDGFRIDTHAEPVPSGVYELVEYTIEKIGPKPLLLERDGNFPALDELLEEVRSLDRIYQRAAARHQDLATPKNRATP